MRRFSVISVLSSLFLFATLVTNAQNTYTMGMVPDSVFICGNKPVDNFYDVGGPSSDYAAAPPSDTISFYSTIGSSGVIEANFLDFFTNNRDTLFVFSGGPGVMVPIDTLYGPENGKRAAGGPFQIYSRPGHGGLTFVFKHDTSPTNTPKNRGWHAQIKEATACNDIQLVSLTAGTAVADADTFKVCLGAQLTFDAIRSITGSDTTFQNRNYSYLATPTGLTYRWTFNDGSPDIFTRTFTKTYNARVSYIITLTVTDSLCCVYTKQFRVNVSTIPSFAGTSGNQVTCEGETIKLLGNASPTAGQNGGNPPNPGGYFYYPPIATDDWTPVGTAPITFTSGNEIEVPLVTSPPNTYCYKFTVTDTYNCSYDSIVCVTVNRKVDPGRDSSVNACANTVSYPLYPVIDTVYTNQTGRWYDIDNSGILNDPITGTINTQMAGTMYTLPQTFRYKFFVQGNPGCDDDSATATVTIYPLPEAGVSNDTILCNTETAFDLLNLLQATQTNGTWTTSPPTLAGVITNNRLDLTRGGASATPPGYVSDGIYFYEYRVSNVACPTDSARATIDVRGIGVPGGDSTINSCSADPSFRLLDALAGNPMTTGTWTLDPNPGDVITGTNPNQVFQTSTSANGVYNYTYTVSRNAPFCPDSSATVTVNHQQSANAGTANAASYDACSADNGGVYDLFTTISGQDTYGSWRDDDGTGALSGAQNQFVDMDNLPFPAGQDTGTFCFSYIVPSLNTVCPGDTETVCIRFTRKADAGQDRTIDVCDNSAIFFLIDSLGGTPATNGEFTGAGPYLPTGPGDNTSRFDPVGEAGNTFTITYTVDSLGIGCPSAQAVLTINVFAMPDAGDDNPDGEACISDVDFDLKPQLSVPFDAANGYFTLRGGSLPNPVWLTNDGIVNISGPFPGCGVYEFDYHMGSPGCPEDTAVITLDVKCLPDAGADDSVFVCTTEDPFALFPLMHTTDQTGNWVDTDGSGGLVTPPNTGYNRMFDPGRVTSSKKYRLGYVIDNSPCTPPDTAYLNIYVSVMPKAGQGDTAEACEDDNAFDLYELLGGSTFDRKGTWYLEMPDPYDQAVENEVNSPLTRPNFISGPDSNLLDVEALVARYNSSGSKLFQRPPSFPAFLTWKYVVRDTNNYTVSPLCPDSVTYGILEISKKFSTPSLKSLTPKEICVTESNFNLATLFNNFDFYPYNPETDKITWSGLTPLTAITRDTILNAGLVPPNTYTLSMTIESAGCDPITVNGIKIKIVRLPFAGTTNSIQVCEDETFVNLYTVVEDPVAGPADQGGTWTHISGPSDNSFSSGGFTMNPSLETIGTHCYEYQYSNAVCPGVDRAQACIEIVPIPDPGPDQQHSVCFGQIIQLSDYFDNIDQSGVFSAVPATGLTATDFANATYDTDQPIFESGGILDVTYTLNNGICAERSATITFTITPRPNAGNDTSFTICQSDNTINLLSKLSSGASTGGSFTPQGGPLSGNNFTPKNADPITYSLLYTVTAPGCTPDQSSMNITVEKTPEAGTNGFVEICSDADAINLLSQALNGPRDLNGTFVSVNPSIILGGAQSEMFDPLNAPGPGTYDFIYTVPGNICPNDQAIATVRVIAAPKSGRNDTTITLCSSTTQYNLFAALGVQGTHYDLGGTFRDGNGNPLGGGSVIRPVNMPLGTYTFTYTVLKTNCDPSITTITANIVAQPDAGPDGDTLVCTNGPDLDLTKVLPQYRAGGTWIVSCNTPNGFLGNVFQVSAAGNSTGTYCFDYILSANGCPNDTARAFVTITTAPQAGQNNVQSICLNGNPVSLSDFLIAPFNANGTFSVSTKMDNDNSRIIPQAFGGGIFRPALTGPGKYVFTYTVSAAGCEDAVAEITLNVFSAGRDTTLDICRDVAQIDLNSLTKTNVSELGNNWSVTSAPQPPVGTLTNNIFRPNRAAVNVPYTITLATNFPAPYGCSPKVVVTVRDTIYITQKKTECFDGGIYRVSFKLNGGAPGQSNWTVNNGTVDANDVFTSNSIPAGAPYVLTIDNKLACDPIQVRGSSACGDNDDDDVVDDIDLDDDNDGVPDTTESRGYIATNDDDADGWANYEDADFCTSVGGTINNQNVCSVFDFDNDGTINQFDLDSDNDGISDLMEGIPVSGPFIEGPAVNGIVGQSMTDIGLDGWYDVAQGLFPSNNVVPNTDGTDGPNFLDTDSDDDGISDQIEGAGSIAVLPPNTDSPADLLYDFMDLDSDADSICDKFEGSGDPAVMADSDADGTGDFRDKDADNDGIPDRIEARKSATGCVAPEDFDNDGLGNFRDTDSDNDGIPDQHEAGPTPLNPRNTRNQTTPDYLNEDSDLDGICDRFEGYFESGSVVSDVDKDGIEDYRDLDADNDSIPDALEKGLIAGCEEPVDTDTDRTHDFRDMDSDNDGLCDNFEAGIVPTVPMNSDSDMAYDFQDFDSDDDCIPDAVEAIAPYDPAFIPACDKPYMFADEDNIPDYLDSDSDGDGIPDEQEAGVDCSSPVDSDALTDRFPDFRDKDSDNDGITDRIEKADDCDGDGRPNYQDAGDNCEITTFIPEGFSPNGDNVNDYFEIPDLTEFPGSSLKIFNRWGAIVFESSTYNNRWDGTYNGEELPSGTYFYLLDLGVGQDAIKGYVYINR